MQRSKTVQPIAWAWLRWLPALAWMAVIFWGSSRPGEETTLMIALGPLPWWEINKVAHVVAHLFLYAVLAVLLSYAMGGSRRTVPAVLAISLVYGISDELHQTMVPGRGPSPIDVGVDMVGAAMGCLLWGRPFWPSR